MNKTILGTLLSLSFTLCVSAQLNNEVLSEAREARAEILKQHRAERRAQDQLGKRSARTESAAASITDAEVGEASSFNKNARFFGIATSGFVVLDPVCDPVALELGPDDRCLVVDPNSATTQVGTFNDIGRVTLPGKLADNVIYLIGNHNTNFVLLNPTGSSANALITYSPSITIESDALNDPAAIDPFTGAPMNGSYTTGGLGSKNSSGTLAAGANSVQTESYSRANTNGLSRTFWAALGLPPTVINNIYKKPMTIKLNVTVRARRVESGLFTFSTRLFAN
jgi:hypothetical protein